MRYDIMCIRIQIKPAVRCNTETAIEDSDTRCKYLSAVTEVYIVNAVDCLKKRAIVLYRHSAAFYLQSTLYI